MPQLMSKPMPPGEITPVRGVHGGDAADGEAVAPVAVGHAVSVVDDAGEAGDVGGLLEDPGLHAGRRVSVAIIRAGTRMPLL